MKLLATTTFLTCSIPKDSIVLGARRGRIFLSTVMSGSPSSTIVAAPVGGSSTPGQAPRSKAPTTVPLRSSSSYEDSLRECRLRSWLGNWVAVGGTYLNCDIFYNLMPSWDWIERR